jgi:IclR family pca regulon transcriptional regulator
VLLASLPEDQLEGLLEHAHPEQLTEHTITSKERLAQEIRRARVQAYAVVDQELELGLRTMAVPLRNFRGDTVAALNISVHAGRISAEGMVERYLPALLKVQVELSALL